MFSVVYNAFMLFSKYIKKIGQWWFRRMKLNTNPVVKVYHGFGSDEGIKLYGHVFAVSPFKQEKFRRSFWYNSISLFRLFMIRPIRGATVEIDWYGQKINTQSQDDGFFHFEWQPSALLNEGWHDVQVNYLHGTQRVTGEGKIFVPGKAQIALVSDIDDTFLVSHSANLRKRLYVLLTKNARSRRTFDGVVQHYQMLATGDKNKLLRPFFYVSSSEWNLYDYIREFSNTYKLPEGIYLLNQVKQLHQFLNTGHTGHTGKYARIVRLLTAYPDKQFVLFGDDSQQDPDIYYKLSKDFPGRIYCIYLRHVRTSRLPIVRKLEAKIREEGGAICYFEHSSEAIAHSKQIGLI
jgi:phosphatidate phosphatase APP1